MTLCEGYKQSWRGELCDDIQDQATMSPDMLIVIRGPQPKRVQGSALVEGGASLLTADTGAHAHTIATWKVQD